LKTTQYMKLNILVISFRFPPIPGVGGRRWSKFAKYLSADENINLIVISSKAPNTSNLEHQKENFKHVTLPSNYPKYIEFLEFKKQNIWSKVMFRLQRWQLMKSIPGNFYDFSAKWETHFKKSIPKILRDEKIDAVIVSGPPYRQTKYLIDLKPDFDSVDFIIDCRDPWNDVDVPFMISDERKKYEESLEKEVLAKFDKVIVVSEFQKQNFLKVQPAIQSIFVIPNGFDTDDYENIKVPNKSDNDVIRIVHFGTLHATKKYYWEPFLLALNSLKKQKPELYDHIQVDFVGLCPDIIINQVKSLQLAVKIHGQLPKDDAFEILADADIALWFKFDGAAGDFATKFGDYIALKKYMWVFSVKGEVTEHIEENKIGKTFLRDDVNLIDTIYSSLEELDKSRIKFNPDYDTAGRSIEHLTQKVIEILRI
jgi:glycosyltransferase involved in cell wall biosynthesis